MTRSGGSKRFVPSKSADADWTRTPAALFASIVLGCASIGGLAWSMARTIEHDASVITQAKMIEAGEPLPSAIVRVEINSANAAQLDLLPAIGPKLALRIVEDRVANGRFETLKDLDRVKGIGPKTLEKIRPRVVIADE